MMASSNVIRRETGFFWQGILIALPALLLAAAGFYLLRQDRLLADRQAEAEAGRLAGSFSVSVTRMLSELELPDPVEARRWVEAAGPAGVGLPQPGRPGAGEELAILLGKSGELIYPPAESELPLVFEDSPPESASQREARLLLESAFSSSDAESTRSMLEAYRATQPDPTGLARIWFRGGSWFERHEDLPQARQLWEDLREGLAGERLTESGVRIRWLAELRLIQSAARDPASSPAQLGEWIGSLIPQLVLKPSALSDVIWEEVSAALEAWPEAGRARREAEFVIHEWNGIRERYRQARLLHALMRERGQGTDVETPPQSAWLDWRGRGREWIVDLPDMDSRWRVSLPESQIVRNLGAFRELPGLPEYLDFGLEIAGEELLPAKSSGRTLAELNGQWEGNPSAVWTVRAVLGDPDRLYARQRQRTLSFGLLIAAAAAAVLFGGFLAWRSFDRQRQLSTLKTNFVSSVSHELRAPIASVRLMAEELEDQESVAPVKTREYHRFISQECRRLSALIENVLDFARQEQGRKVYEMEPADVVSLVRETVRLMQPGASERGLRLELDIQAPDCEPEVDGRAVQQALVNLIDNAIKHSPRDGAVRVGLEMNPPAGNGARPPEAGNFLIWVEDQGPGIPDGEQERIFEWFYRRGSELRRETRGVGLGLAIVRHVVTAHGGRVKVRSREGEGSRFEMVLPLVEKRKPDENNEIKPC